MINTNYSIYLSSNKWKELRRKVWKRAKGRCEYCQKPACATHHVKYPKRFEDDHEDNLIVVCKRCHELNHGIRDEDRLRNEIRKRINYPESKEAFKYKFYEGIDFSASNDNCQEDCRIRNFKLIQDKFKDYVPNLNLDDFQLWSWKGSCWWGPRESYGDSTIEDFTGLGSDEIIFWIIKREGVR